MSSGSSSRARRVALLTATTVVAAGLSLGGVVGGAQADPPTWTSVSTATDLANAISAQDMNIVLANSITSTAPSITGSWSTTINLAGHDLTVKNISVSLGVTVVDQDSGGNPITGGTFTANSTQDGLAGITVDADAPGHASARGQFHANGVTVVASGGAHAAGIGGDSGNSSGAIDITDSTVTATGGVNAAGIGGGDGGDAGYANVQNIDAISITDSDVTAHGGDDAAALGGGAGGNVAASITDLSPGHSLSLDTTNAGASVVGPGVGGSFADGLSNPYFLDANMVLNAPDYLDRPALPADNIYEFGANSGALVTLSGTGSITGTGELYNYGAITLDTAKISSPDTIAVNNRLVDFDGSPGSIPEHQYVQVFAPTLASGGVTDFPPASELKYSVFRYWSDGDNPVTTSSDLQALGDHIYAKYSGVFSYVNAGLTGTILAGSTHSIPLTAADIDGNQGDQSLFATVTSNGPGDVVNGDSVTFGRAGTRTVTAKVSPLTLTAVSTSVTVVEGPLSEISLAPSATSAVAGTSVSFTTTGADAGGDSLGDVSGATTLTSNVGSDVLTGQSFRFTSVGDHTITATNGALTTTTVITVTAAPLTHLTLHSTGSAVAGGTLTYTVSGIDDFDNPYPDQTSNTQLSSDVITDSVNNTDHTVTFHSSGTHTITATDGDESVTDVVVVAQGLLTSLTVAPTTGGTSVAAGATVTLVVTAADSEGDSYGNVTADSVITSSVPSDHISGASVTMTASGSHTLTARDGLVTKTIVFTVAAGAFTRIALLPATATAFVGHSRTFTLAKEDQYGNVVGAITSGEKLKSSSKKDTVKKFVVAFGSTGSRKITATALGKSTSLTIVVSKDVAVLGLTVPPTVHAKKKTTVTVSLAAGPSGSKPTGSVRIYYTSKKYVTVKFSSSSHTTKTATLPSLKAGTYSIHAKYEGSSKYATTTTPAIIRVFA